MFALLVFDFHFPRRGYIHGMPLNYSVRIVGARSVALGVRTARLTTIDDGWADPVGIWRVVIFRYNRALSFPFFRTPRDYGSGNE